jgi:hypothetical protein
MIIVGGPVIFLLLLLAFKPVRMIVGWLLFAVLCIGLYACAQMPPAHAQSSPMVQCQIGSWAQVMPDYACEAMEAGAEKLHQERSDTEGTGIKQCAVEMTRYLRVGPQDMLNECQAVWVAKRQDAHRMAWQATRGCFPREAPQCAAMNQALGIR